MLLGRAGWRRDPQKWTRTNTNLTIDPDGWESKGSVAQIGSEPEPAGGLVKLSLTTQELPDGSIGYDTAKQTMPDGSIGYIKRAALADSVDEIQSAGTRARADEGGVHPTDQVTLVSDSAVPAPAPDRAPLKENAGKFPHTYLYGPRDSAEEIEDEGTETTVETGDRALGSDGIVTKVTDSATPPETPAVPADLPAGAKFLRRRTRRRGARWVHRFGYGWGTEAEKIALAAAGSNIDPRA